MRRSHDATEHGIECQVPGYTDGMARILIALDRSEASIRAAETVKRLFENPEILAINVASVAIPWADSLTWGAVGPFPSPSPLYSPEEIDDFQHLAEEQAGSTASTVANEAGLASVEPVSATGDVAEEIVRAAHEHAVDLIVVGWTNKGWFARLLEGSVAQDIIRTADIPVLVAK